MITVVSYAISYRILQLRTFLVSTDNGVQKNYFNHEHIINCDYVCAGMFGLH